MKLQAVVLAIALSTLTPWAHAQEALEDLPLDAPTASNTQAPAGAPVKAAPVKPKTPPAPPRSRPLPRPQPENLAVPVEISSSPIAPGDLVVENYQGVYQVKHVRAISADSQYLLDDNQWYNSDYIQPLIGSYNGIRVGQSVVENYQGIYKVYRVTHISGNGVYQLENNQWYSPDYIQNSVSSYNGIYIGQSVMTDYSGSDKVGQVTHISANGVYEVDSQQWYSSDYIVNLATSYNGIYVDQNVATNYQGQYKLHKVARIASNGLYQMDDGVWYNSDYVQSLVTSYNGIYSGQQVAENYQGVYHLMTVQQITASGVYLLSNGQWYSSDYVQSLVTSYNGIYVGQQVLETYNGQRKLQKVQSITNSGVFLLDDGIWYSSSYIETVRY